MASAAARRVLLIEDDETTRALHARLLARRHNVHLIAFFDGDQGLRHALLDPPDLLITDVCHPGTDGMEILRRLRRNEQTARLPVVIISGSFGTYNQEDFWERGATQVLAKPFEPGDLLSVVARHLNTQEFGPQDLVVYGRETAGLDYKENLLLDRRDARAALAKDVIAFANNGGGNIVVGVAEVAAGRFEPTGVERCVLEEVEVTRLNKALRGFVDPPIAVSVEVAEVDERLFAVLTIPPADECPVFAARENRAASLYCGRLYCRTQTAESAEIRDSHQARKLIARIVAVRLAASKH